jgi:hypothetical protein
MRRNAASAFSSLPLALIRGASVNPTVPTVTRFPLRPETCLSAAMPGRREVASDERISSPALTRTRFSPVILPISAMVPRVTRSRYFVSRSSPADASSTACASL